MRGFIRLIDHVKFYFSSTTPNNRTMDPQELRDFELLLENVNKVENFVFLDNPNPNVYGHSGTKPLNPLCLPFDWMSFEVSGEDTFLDFLGEVKVKTMVLCGWQVLPMAW